MDNTRRVDVGFTFWIVTNLHGARNMKDVVDYIMRHGYSPGDGTTFVILDPILIHLSRGEEWIILAYGDPRDIAFSHTMELKGKTYTMIDFDLDIADMTKYTISSNGKVELDGVPLGITSEQAAFARGIQYNRGSPITNFRYLTSYILSHYNLDQVSMVITPTTSKYSVRSTTNTMRLVEMQGIILYER